MRKVFVGLMIVGMWMIGMQAYATLPTLPTTFHTDYSIPTGGTLWTVKASSCGVISNCYAGSGALQSAIDACVGGDVIVVDHTYADTLALKLPIKYGLSWVYVISDNLAALPEHKRVSLTNAVSMPTITAYGTAYGYAALYSYKSASRYRFCGINFDTGIGNVNILLLLGWGSANYSDGVSYWDSASSASDLPSYIWFDRCIIQCSDPLCINSTTPMHQSQIGLEMQGTYLAVFDCYIDNFKAPFAEAYGVHLGQGAGPFKIKNNFISSTGQVIFFGGSDPSVWVPADPGSVLPHDVEITGNYIYKRPEWMGATMLASDINESVTTIPVTSTVSFASSGTLYVYPSSISEGEQVIYTSKDATHFYGCTRDGTRAHTVAGGTSVQSNDVTKNLIELKYGIRVLISGNVLQNQLRDGVVDGNQNGIAIVINPSDQYGTAPYGQITDLTITNNKIRSCAKIFNLGAFAFGGGNPVGGFDLVAATDHATSYKVIGATVDTPYGPVRNTFVATTALSSGINGSVTTIPVISTSGYDPYGGMIDIDGEGAKETVSYTSLDATNFYLASRSGSAHLSGVSVSPSNTLTAMGWGLYYYWHQPWRMYIDGSNGWTAGYYTIVSGNGTKAVLDRVACDSACRAGALPGHYYGSFQTQRVNISNNLFEDIKASYGSSWQGGFNVNGYVQGGVKDLTIKNNALIYNGVSRVAMAYNPDQTNPYTTGATDGFEYSNNISFVADRGVHDQSYSDGMHSWIARLVANSSTYTFLKNVFITRSIDANYSDATTNYFPQSSTPWGSDGTVSPPGTYVDQYNYGPREISSVGFTTAPATFIDTYASGHFDASAYDAANYLLTGASPYHNLGTDGKDIGPDWTALNAATAHAIDGNQTVGVGTASRIRIRK